MIVSELLSYLLDRYPVADAEDWDHVGLSVGDPESEVTGVACALDATEANIRRAHRFGANVLLTHHPVYIKAPTVFAPHGADRPQSSAAVYTSARLGINVISLHTNLDRSIEARNCLCNLLGCMPSSSLEFSEDPQSTGLGALAELEEEHTLNNIANIAARSFDSAPRVWGKPSKSCRRIAVLGGSLGDFGEVALAAGADTVITGEAGYHITQDLSIRGLGVILLGHDRSEEPFVDILMNSCIDAGIDPAQTHRILNPRQWWTVTEEGDFS